MDNTKWYALGDNEWHVDVGSAAEEHLLVEGAIEIDGPDGEPIGEKPAKALSEMSKKEMLAFADEHDIDIANRRANNETLLEEIEAALKAAEADAAGSGDDGDGEPTGEEGDEA